MTAYYNEIDPYAAQWLRNLIDAGHIASGVVDERPIQEIEAYELVQYTQCHFFAGIGIWSHALRQAGWPDNKPIWTGSCPCQPFSNAGQKKGFNDERHLWPTWFNLINQCRPPVIVGEQVASALAWIDLVSADLETAGYAVGASDLCAAGFDGAHIRQRLYFVGMANEQSERRNRIKDTSRSARGNGTEISSTTIGMADIDYARPQRRTGMFECIDQCPTRAGSMVSGMEYSDLSSEYERASGREQSLHQVNSKPNEKFDNSNQRKIAARWLDVDWLLCRNPAGEPSWRPVEPGTFPLAHAVTNRMGKLRAYGNGLDAETAAQFCSAVKEIAESI